jgi:hypothetical protein
MNYAWDVIACLRYGKISMYLKYGLIGDAPGMVGSLDEYYICQGARTRTFFAAKTINKFITRGSIQLKSTSSDSATFTTFVAFHDPAKHALAISMVTGAQAQTIQLAGSNLPSSFELWVTNTSTDCVNQGSSPSSGTFTIPANSVATLYGTGYTPSATGVRERPRGIAVNSTVGRSATGGAFSMDGRRLAPSATPAAYRGVVVSKAGAGTRVSE